MSAASTPTRSAGARRSRRGCSTQAGDDPDAEIVFIAVPAAGAAPDRRRAPRRPGRRPDAVVTDVSGVKAAIIAAVGHPRFIGGHPMAGSEQMGLAGADPELFVGAHLGAHPDRPTTDLDAFGTLSAVVSLARRRRGRPVPEDHDRLVAVVSHVPHLVAATLMNAASEGAEQRRRAAAAGRRRASGT